MSRSIRKETSSLAFGIVGRFGGSSAGFVVTALNAASAASREVVVLRVLSADIIMSSRWGFTLLNANRAAKAAVARVDHQRLTVCPRAKAVDDAARLGKHVLPPECFAS
jgi:hypothetical protein